MVNGIRSVIRTNLTDQVVRQLIELVVSGQLKPGDRLPAAPDMARDFQVSRTVIREAVSVLSSQGFVAVQHGRGCFVCPSDQWNTLYPGVLLIEGRETAIRELMQVREIIEPHLAFLAATRATSEDIDAIEKCITIGNTTHDTVQADIGFHLAVARASRNEVLLIMLHSVGELLEALETECFTAQPETREQGLYRHRIVLERIKRHHAEGARDAMLVHMREALSNYLAVPSVDQSGC